MRLFVISYPGSWIVDCLDRNIESLIMMLETDLIEGTIAINNFESEFVIIDINDAILNGTEFRKGIPEIPPKIIYHLPFYWAKSFVFTLDNIYKKISQIAKFDDRASSILSEINEKYPSLIELRNSIHHTEDRVQYKGKNGKTFTPLPFEDGYMISTNGSLILGDLHGNSYTWTSAKGETIKLEISYEVFEFFVDKIQKIIQLYSWSGRQRSFP